MPSSTSESVCVREIGRTSSCGKASCMYLHDGGRRGVRRSRLARLHAAPAAVSSPCSGGRGASVAPRYAAQGVGSYICSCGARCVCARVCTGVRACRGTRCRSDRTSALQSRACGASPLGKSQLCSQPTAPYTHTVPSYACPLNGAHSLRCRAPAEVARCQRASPRLVRVTLSHGVEVSRSFRGRIPPYW